MPEGSPAELPPPLLSVILATDCYETIRPVVRHLRRQTIRDRLEVVIVIPAAAPLDGGEPELGEPELAGFASVDVVRIETVYPLGWARAAGVRSARAPLVFIGETHTYPHPTWAEALVEAHAGPWAGVIPGFGNANPRGALSAAIFLLDYGRWLYRLAPHETTLAPTHNVAYKRQALLDLGGELDDALTFGHRLTDLFHAAGLRLSFQPAARIDHLNVARWRPWVEERLLGGVLIAGLRARRWSPWRRLVYFCGAPLIPVVLLLRLREPVRAAWREEDFPAGALPALVAATVISALGEMIGYARGVGRSVGPRMTELEVHKVRYAGRRTEPA